MIKEAATSMSAASIFFRVSIKFCNFAIGAALWKPRVVETARDVALDSCKILKNSLDGAFVALNG